MDFLPKQFATEVELHLLVHHFRDDTGGAILDEFAWLQWHVFFLLRLRKLKQHLNEIYRIRIVDNMLKMEWEW